jgi:excinuclease ABC subunit C
MSPNLKLCDIVSNLPHKPGVYQFLNEKEEIIYIGKAKDIQKRVSSYFGTETKSYKQETLTKKIKSIKYFVVDNESDALLLENNLIKEYKPRYNVLLKDDKTYPWICIKKENFPRVQLTRKYIADGSDYFGPYTSVLTAKTLLSVIRKIFKLRSCNLLLDEESINKGKYKICLEYHLGNCKGPCEGLQTLEDYNQTIVQINELLKGNFHQVIQYLQNLMNIYVKKLMFEEAEIVRLKMDMLEKFKGKSTIVNPKISNTDIIYLIDEEKYAYVNFFKIVNGAIVQAHNTEIVKNVYEDKADLLGYVIFNFRQRFHSNSTEIIVPFKPNAVLPQVKFMVPVRGDKKKLLELSKNNAESFRTDMKLLQEKGKWFDEGSKILVKLKVDLRLRKIPKIIECFDISNIQGSNQVASCVVFKEAKPSKSAYRHYNIRTVNGQNDFASMEEVIFRKYKRVLKENGVLPNLIIIDGGKGQLNSASKILKSLGIYHKVAIISVAKRLEEIFIPGDPIPLYLDKNSTSLRLIQRIRNEAHRFGIALHRNKRSVSQIQSGLMDIPGIGAKTVEKLLASISDAALLKKMNIDELTEIAGKKAGKILFNHFSR